MRLTIVDGGGGGDKLELANNSRLGGELANNGRLGGGENLLTIVDWGGGALANNSRLGGGGRTC